MKILGLDTSTLVGGIAVVDGNGGGGDVRVLGAARTSREARGADVLVTIDQVMREAELAARALEAVAVGVGPGSFTGLRIGMATAKGIAFAAGCPLWGVSSLQALAWDARAVGTTARSIVAALDARKGEIYAVQFTGDALTMIDREQVLAPAAFVAWASSLDDDVAFAGDAYAAYPEPLAALAARWQAAATTPSGVAVAQLALAGARTDILVAGVPTYVRKAEAEILYPDGVPGALRTR